MPGKDVRLNIGIYFLTSHWNCYKGMVSPAQKDGENRKRGRSNKLGGNDG